MQRVDTHQSTKRNIQDVVMRKTKPFTHKHPQVLEYSYTCMYVHYSGPPATLTNVIAANICLTDFTASWDPVTSDPVCGPVSYDVTISPSGGVTMMRITDISYNFTGLIPNISYTVTVAGRNNAGVGRSSSTTIRTFQNSKLTFLYTQYT